MLQHCGSFNFEWPSITVLVGTGNFFVLPTFEETLGAVGLGAGIFLKSSERTSQI
jgi:hypothetical protein